MQVVEVDVAGLEAREALLHSAQQPAPAVAAAIGCEGGRRVPTLVATIHAVAVAPDGPADNLFRPAAAIGVGRVDEVDAGLARLCTMRSASASSAWSPNIIAPRQSDETFEVALAEPALRDRHASVPVSQAWPRAPAQKTGSTSSGSLTPLVADRVELAVVLDRVDEGVEPLQLVDLAAAKADPEMQRPQHDLDLIVLAGVVAVEPLVDEQARAAEIDLTGDQRLQLGRFVVEALEREALLLLERRQHQVLHGAARHADLLALEIVDRLDVDGRGRDQRRGLVGVRHRVPDLQRALGRDAEQADQHVDAAAQQQRDAVGAGDRNELHLDAEILGHEPRDIRDRSLPARRPCRSGRRSASSSRRRRRSCPS